MLTRMEQDDLYTVIASVFGEDASIKAVKYQFNEQTVEVVEEAIAAKANCDGAMKSLLVGLLGASTMLTKGWLRKVVSKFAKGIRSDNVKLNGYGCLVGSKAKWKTPIITSTI